MKWVIEKQIELHGRKMDALIPNPEIPKELAIKRFEELLKEAANRKAS